MTRAIVLWLCLVSLSVGQSTSSSTPFALTGLKNPVKVGDLLLVDADSQPVLGVVGLIEVNAEATSVEVSAFSLPAGEIIAPRMLEPRKYAIESPGVWVVTVFGNGVTGPRQFKLTIGKPSPPVPPPGPDPLPVPTPDVPPDGFSNIGQRVAKWVAGKPDNAKLGAAYLFAALQLKTNPSMTVNDVTAKLSADASAIPNYATTYSEFRASVNADLAQRWDLSPLTRGMLADYFSAVAAGCGVKAKTMGGGVWLR